MAEQDEKQAPNPVGRPSKYNETMPAMVDLFLKERKQAKLLPTAAGLARYVDVDKTTLYRWAEKHPEFRTSLNKMNDEQEDLLVQGGIKNEYNSTITKLMLSSNHGYKERSDTTSDGKAIKCEHVDFSDIITRQLAAKDATASAPVPQ